MSIALKLQERIDGQQEWLSKTAPECQKEQKHLEEGSQERVYWHYGYMVALVDVRNLILRTAPDHPQEKA